MHRLIAFGCSCTYGEALPDCDLGPDPAPKLPGARIYGPNPSELAWPSMAADLLGVPCINHGYPGLSNHGILTSILEHQWQAGDMACVLWSYTQRDTIYGDRHEDEFINLSHTVPEQFTARRDAFYSAHTQFDLNRRSWIYQHTAALHLRSHGITYAMGSLETWDENARIVPDHRNIHSDLFRGPFLDTGLDGMHPGISTHRYWGELFAQRLRQTMDNG